MAFTFSKLASVTVGSGGSATISFANIPQNYKDLCLKFSARSNTNIAGDGDLYYLLFNGSSANFTKKYLYGSGTAAASLSTANNIYGWIDSSDATASTFGNGEIYIPNYTGSSNKSFSTDSVTETNATAAYQALLASLWSNTTAINQITLTSYAGNFVQYSTATLYGIRAEV
jgi:hypothetical protein